MNAIARTGIPFFITLTLAACIPGQQMSRGDLPAGSDVEMVPITAATVSAPRPPATVPQELLSTDAAAPYQIHAGDMLLVTVWEHPELTAPAGSQQQAANNGRLVQSDGSFYFPYAGKLQVEGMTLVALRDTLQQKLARYLRDPQLDVNVVSYGGRISLKGAFQDTAPQDVGTVPLTLDQAIGKAKIDLEQADLSGFTLTRAGHTYPLDLDALNRDGNSAPDIRLQAGDVLNLPFNDRKQVYVLGEVLRPQALTFKTTDMSLTQALGRTGGLDQVTSNGDAVYVIRGIDEKTGTASRVYHLEGARSPAAFALADRFSLQAGDVVWVGPAGITRWNRYISQLLPFTNLIRNAASAQYDIGRNGN